MDLVLVGGGNLMWPASCMDIGLEKWSALVCSVVYITALINIIITHCEPTTFTRTADGLHVVSYRY